MKLRKGDNVIMLSGKDRGKTGKILSADVKSNRVIVQGLNMLKRHVRARQQGQRGQIISKERPVNVPSVALVCKSCGRPTRIGFQIGAGGHKTRICRKCRAEA